MIKEKATTSNVIIVVLILNVALTIKGEAHKVILD